MQFLNASSFVHYQGWLKTDEQNQHPDLAVVALPDFSRLAFLSFGIRSG
jgi:hypothetical protein